MESSLAFMDDLLDFASDIGEEEEDEEEEERPTKLLPNNGLVDSAEFDVINPDDSSPSFPEPAEEELEWILNKDAFPAVETFVDILSDQSVDLPKHHSPISVLENSTSSSNNSSNTNTLMSCCGILNLKVPVRARSKLHRKRRPDIPSQQVWFFISKPIKKNTKVEMTIGRKCQHCGAEKTPQWRAGPLGPKTLCNACGVRYKSGRLVPEYRPASSPTFSHELHSNSHRKVLEMRRQKQSGKLVNPMDTG